MNSQGKKKVNNIWFWVLVHKPLIAFRCISNASILSSLNSTGCRTGRLAIGRSLVQIQVNNIVSLVLLTITQERFNYYHHCPSLDAWHGSSNKVTPFVLHNTESIYTNHALIGQIHQRQQGMLHSRPSKLPIVNALILDHFTQMKESTQLKEAIVCIRSSTGFTIVNECNTRCCYM